MKRLALLICTLLCANLLYAQVGTVFWVDSLQYIVTNYYNYYLLDEVKVYGANSSITTANIPATVSYNGNTYNVTSIGSAFVSCSSLTSVTIPNSVTSIGGVAFYGCSSLTSITIPNSVTSIGGGAFYGCSSLTSVTLSNNITSLPSYYSSSNPHGFFEGCSSLTSVTIPNSVTSIGKRAFGGCSSLTSITIPNSVTSIGDEAFKGCSSLTTLNFNAINCNDFSITNSLYPFYNCPITTINIGDSVQRIPNYFASPLLSLTSVTCLVDNPPTLGYHAFSSLSSYPKNLFVPISSIANYINAGWRNYFNISIEEGNLKYSYRNNELKVIGCVGSDTSIVIPSEVHSYSVTSIGDSAFKNCSSLTSVTIPNSVTSIGKYAFESCYSLTSVTIGNSVASIGDWAFSYCSSLTSITIPNSVTSIGKYAFQYCSSLTSITIPNSVTSVGGGVFYGCYNLTSVTLSNNITSLPSAIEQANPYATAYYYGFFENCSSLTTITIPNSVTSIGEEAFKNCSSLTTITIPNSVTSIGEEAFKNCSSLTSVTIGNSLTSIGDSAFANCDNLTSVSLDMSSIPAGLNFPITPLQNLTFGENVTYIASGAFSAYSFLQNVTCLATTPPTLADNTVFPYPNIATLTVPCGTLEAYSAPTSFWNMFFMGRIEEDCSGIEQAEAESISFFPNPTKSEITFSQAIEKVEVIDLTGKTILTFSNAKTINIESLPAGTYYLRLTNEEKTSLQKVIKQ